ncbi:MAG: hypothetical protein EOR03_03955 [Mesorhizobium sp.]|nr:MAG: hypothetical protein EOR03_03955 [Mesorhizobium sp.]TIL64394.1 MAG: hypothetical protein E5Y77_26840 [Mesorhizobium sp.]
MRGAPAWNRRHSVQHPSTVSALRADPPSPTRGEGKISLHLLPTLTALPAISASGRRPRRGSGSGR